MRGLTLLCSVGFILTASWPKGDTVPLADTGTSQLPPGSISPMSAHTFNSTTNTTTNTSMETEEHKPDNTSVQATQLPVDATGSPPPTVGEDTQLPPGSISPMSAHTFNSTTNTTTNTSMETEEHKPDNTSVQATQLPVPNTPGFPPPTVGEDTQG